MTTLQNRPNTALVVIDVQNGVVEGTHERDAVVANIGTLVDKARRERIPVVWVQHSDEENLHKGSEAWRIVPELDRDEAEPLVEKTYADSFDDTTLETVLSGLRVGRLFVVGAQTDACIRSTLHGAIVRGYDATLVSEERGHMAAQVPDVRPRFEHTLRAPAGRAYGGRAYGGGRGVGCHDGLHSRVPRRARRRRLPAVAICMSPRAQRRSCENPQSPP